MAWRDWFSTRSPAPLVPTRRVGLRGAFVAASQDRLTASWMATTRSINNELRGDLDNLRTRSRELARNNDYARRYLRMVARNLIGPSGFVLQSRVQDGPGRPDTAANQAVEAAFWQWARRGSAEVSGRQSFTDLQRSIALAVARDGEALVRFTGGTRQEPLQLQHIDIARLDTRKNQPAAQGRNAIVMGVEQDGYDRPIAYWIKDDPESATSTRQLAQDLLHIYLPEHASQARGIPWMHAAMLSLHDLGEFNRSAMLSARRGADVLGFIVAPNGDPSPVSDDATAEGDPLKLSAPGTYDVLPEGYDIRTPEYNYPNQVYGEFVKTILQRIASGLDVSYVSLANDLEGVNYSSIRAGVLEERDQWQALQGWFTDAFLEPVFERWIRVALLRGIKTEAGFELPAAKLEKFSAHEWQGRRWAWVDPLKDIEAGRLAVQSGISSPQQIAAQNGLDVEDVLDAIAAFEAMAKAKAVTLVDYGAKPSQAAPERPAQGGAQDQE